MTPDEIDAFIGRFVATAPRPSDHAQTGLRPPAAEPLRGPLADMVDLDAHLDDWVIPQPPLAQR